MCLVHGWMRSRSCPEWASHNQGNRRSGAERFAQLLRRADCVHEEPRPSPPPPPSPPPQEVNRLSSQISRHIEQILANCDSGSSLQTIPAQIALLLFPEIARLGNRLNGDSSVPYLVARNLSTRSGSVSGGLGENFFKS